MRISTKHQNLDQTSEFRPKYHNFEQKKSQFQTNITISSKFQLQDNADNSDNANTDEAGMKAMQTIWTNTLPWIFSSIKPFFQ